MTTWVIINNGNGEMLVAKNGLGFEVDSTGLANTIHAVQWDGTSGEVENKDASTGEATGNTSITSFSDYDFAETAWDAAKAAEDAAEALANAKAQAYQTAYDAAIANGDSEEDAQAAGQTASDAVTSV